MTACEFRPTSSQLLLYPAVGLLLAASQLLSGNPVAAAVLLVAFAVISVMQARWGSDLTPEALVVRGITTRVIPWSEITGIETGSVLGTTLIRVRRANGSRTQMRAPLTGFLQRDPEFPAKFTQIEGCWREHGGDASGSPVAAPA